MATIQDIQKEIDRLEADIEPISSLLDSKILEFKEELAPAVKTWMTAHLERRIVTKAEKINEGGLEPLRAMKSDLRNLLERLPQICENAIGKPPTWPHHTKETRDEYRERNEREAYFPAVFRKAISNLGTLLDKHGLLTNTSSHAEWKKSYGDTYSYAINPGFDRRKFQSVLRYDDFRKKHMALAEQLDKKRSELSKAKARELWDKA